MKKNSLTDFATIIGLAGATLIVLLALYKGGKFSLFFNLQAALIVFGGSSFIVLIKFNLKQFFRAWVVAIQAFFLRRDDVNALIDTIIKLQKKSRLHGLLALEGEKVDHPFLKKGIRYVVDNINPAIVKNTLHKETYHTLERHQTGVLVFRALADVSPAMGMIGTLIGLMQMLAGMDNPHDIGPAMAVALLTTLYGAMMAHMFATPIADKLVLRSQEERLVKLLITDGVLGIQQAIHPYLLEEMLLAYLPGSERQGGRWKAAVKSDEHPELKESGEPGIIPTPTMPTNHEPSR